MPRNAEKLSKLFQGIFECWSKKEVGYYHRCIGYFYQILAECSKQYASEKTSESKIRLSVDYINANFTNPSITIKEIAAKSFMSEVYFRKIFKEEYGTSPQKHIMNLRVQKAAELIETGD